MVGVELNLKVVNLMVGEQMAPEFIKINPQHTIPTIVDDGFALNESRAICGYLVQTYAKDDSLYPKDPKKRAIVDQRLYFDMDFYKKFQLVYIPIMFRGATKLDEAAQKDFAASIEHLNTFLTQNKYVAGDQLTIADICLMANASTFESGDPQIFDKYPKIKNWIETCKSELVDFNEINQIGADIFGQMLQGALAKLE